MIAPPWASAEDRTLLERAAETSHDVSEDGLRRLTGEAGVDCATAALYAHLRCESRHRDFISRIESAEAAPLAGTPPRIVVMPGAFHAEYPHTGADGARVMELASELGWPAKRVIVPSLGPMQRNAAGLVELLASQPGQPAIVVSLSKGGADMRAALARPGAAGELRDVRAWLNLSGITLGTPLVDWLRARWLRCLGVRMLLRLRGQRFASLAEMERGPGTALDRPLILPTGMRAIHVLGFPLQRHLGDDWARRGHGRLAALGPNDGGGVLLADALRLAGDVYPVWGADHYLRPAWDVRSLLLRLLRDATAG